MPEPRYSGSSRRLETSCGGPSSGGGFGSEVAKGLGIPGECCPVIGDADAGGVEMRDGNKDVSAFSARGSFLISPFIRKSSYSPEKPLTFVDPSSLTGSFGPTSTDIFGVL